MEWTMGLRCSLSHWRDGRWGAALHFLNEDVVDGGATLPLLNGEVSDRGTTLLSQDRGWRWGLYSSLSQHTHIRDRDCDGEKWVMGAPLFTFSM